MDWIDYRKELGIGFSDQDKCSFLTAKIRNYFITTNDQISFKDYFTFCNMTGEICKLNSYEINTFVNFENIYQIIFEHADSLEDFISYYIAFINSYRNPLSFNYDLTPEKCKKILEKSLNEAHIPFQILEDNNNYFIFPKGAEELDDALVSAPLKWLQKYPKSHSAFIKALTEYSEATPQNSSEIADKFRKALETFFQEFFGGSKSLENYISNHIYEKFLDQCGIPQELRHEFENTVKSYCKFINNNAKHQDKTPVNILEYLMYQTGNIIRLLITLKPSD